MKESVFYPVAMGIIVGLLLGLKCDIIELKKQVNILSEETHKIFLLEKHSILLEEENE